MEIGEELITEAAEARAAINDAFRQIVDDRLLRQVSPSLQATDT